MLMMREQEKIGIALSPQLTNQSRADQSLMACHIDLCVSVHKLVGVTMDTVSRIGDELVAFGKFQISRHHFRNELAKAYLRFPAQLGSRLARVTHEGVHFRRTKIARIDCNDALPSLIEGLLAGTLSAPGQFHSHLCCCGNHEVADGKLLPRGNHEVIRL